MFAITNRGKYKLQLSVQFLGILIGLAWIFISIKVFFGSNSTLKTTAVLTFIMGCILIGLFFRNFFKLRKSIMGRISAFEKGIEFEAEIISILPKLIGRPPFYEWKICIELDGNKVLISDSFLSAPLKPEHRVGEKLKVKINPQDLSSFYICD